MEVKGKIKVINDTQVVSDKFSKRESVVTTDEIYPQDILIQFIHGALLPQTKPKRGDYHGCICCDYTVSGKLWRT